MDKVFACNQRVAGRVFNQLLGVFQGFNRQSYNCQDAPKIIGRVSDILIDPTGVVLVVLERFQVLQERDDVYGMPVLVRRDGGSLKLDTATHLSNPTHVRRSDTPFSISCHPTLSSVYDEVVQNFRHTGFQTDPTHCTAEGSYNILHVLLRSIHILVPTTRWVNHVAKPDHLYEGLRELPFGVNFGAVYSMRLRRR
ncbi:hypothetical protein B0H14DRAFT_2610933 [Mycena olivaceomarginata]|nr:hypothetical protein B0H14DRAFT_2610933 [Mycena olivaceomarginata]